MDSREGMDSGVTVIGAEPPSSYHIAPRAENPNPVTGASAVTPSPVSAGLTGALEKKKRGRPRKYGPEGTSSRQMSPMPISASAPSTVNVHFSAEKPSGRRLSVSEKKQRQKIAHDVSGDLVQSSSGGNFAPHAIRVNTGEDITMKIISFSQQGPRAVCILSAMGFISNVTLRQPDSSGGTLTYEGRFEILSLSGSFTPTEIVGGSRVSRCGGMSITLISPDGRIIGGQLAGLLIAASPVDLLVGSFLPSNHQELRPKKHKYEFKHVPPAVPAATVHTPNVEQNNFNAQDHQNNSVGHNQNYAASVTPFQSENNWTIMPASQDSRKSTTDINIALQE